METAHKIAIASLDDKGLDGEVSGHFGRCPYYTLVRVRQGLPLEAEVVPNPHFQRHAPGVMPRFIRGLGANVVLAGGMGPRAVQLFREYDIDVATGPLDSAYVYYDFGIGPPPMMNIAPVDNEAHNNQRNIDSAKEQMNAFWQPDGAVINFCDGACDPE